MVLLNTDVSVGPGLTAFTQILRSFKSTIQQRAKERTAAFVAQYTLLLGYALIEPMDAFKMIDPPSANIGNAF